MRNFKLATLISVFGLLLAGCTATNTNTNTNTNLNTNANANTNANVNANLNANRSGRAANANITREEYDRDRDSYASDARQLGRTIGAGANDGWLWTKTRALLAAADDLRDSTINVDVDNAVVTLSGTVATAAQKSSAEKVAKSVEGVASVKNNLTVQPAT
ncbi:MAG TPA: BON domain-containing protein [Pyrinomonadaceae bacterium]|nr:BON domain-containing protein [Pyrinomonadaceae bacterium]